MAEHSCHLSLLLSTTPARICSETSNHVSREGSHENELGETARGDITAIWRDRDTLQSPPTPAGHRVGRPSTLATVRVWVAGGFHGGGRDTRGTHTHVSPLSRPANHFERLCKTTAVRRRYPLPNPVTGTPRLVTSRLHTHTHSSYRRPVGRAARLPSGILRGETRADWQSRAAHSLSRRPRGRGETYLIYHWLRAERRTAQPIRHH